MNKQRIYYWAAIFFGILLAVLFILGVASPDGDFGLSVTRGVGALAFIFLILADGKGIWFPPHGKIKSSLIFALPALIVAVNNMPIIPLISGEAYLSGDAAGVLLLLLQCFLTGLFEETAYRGIITVTVMELCGGTKKRLLYSLIISSAAFGVSHIFNLLAGAGVGATLMQVGYSSLIGAMCAVVMVKTRSIILPVVIHSIYNFCGYLVPKLGGGTIWTVPEIILTAVVSVAAAAFYIKAALEISDGDVEFWSGDNKKSPVP
ncbi:MAG: CPBP family intramembrane metalloprotease [Firmicutes bacterium]|nr:CPBP family intramembrane metalloprotease [Bacillota bacterium]